MKGKRQKNKKLEKLSERKGRKEPLSDFVREHKKIEEKIWSLVQLKEGMKVLDVGMGEDAHSTKKLIDSGALVTAIDTDLKTLNEHRSLKTHLIRADVSQLPLPSSVFDLSVAYFTLHEIDPRLHQRAISELVRVSRKVMIVEPGPGKDRLYKLYYDIWNRAMHSIGKFEDYQPISFWRMSLKLCGENIKVLEKITHKNKLIGDEADRFMSGSMERLKSRGVEEKYINEFHDLTEDIRHRGMKFSDISVVIGEA